MADMGVPEAGVCARPGPGQMTHFLSCGVSRLDAARQVWRRKSICAPSWVYLTRLQKLGYQAFFCRPSGLRMGVEKR